MPTVTVGQENTAGIEIHYEDHGAGQPVVLIHGYPLSGRAWDKQVPALLEAGYRVITYDRRGFGQSSQPASGYDYDTFAADLQRPAGTPGPARRRAGRALDGHRGGHPLPGPLRLGPGGQGGAGLPDPAVPAAGGRQPRRGAAEPVRRVRPGRPGRHPGLDEGIPGHLLQHDTLRGTLVSDQAFQASWNLAVTASATAAVACIGTWTTDFRADLPEIDVPILVIQGDADQVLPMDKTGKRLPGLIKDMQLTVVEGGPHAIPWTHAAQVNTALLDFIRS